MIECTSIEKVESPSTTWPIIYVLEFTEDGNDCEENSITLNGLIYEYELTQDQLASMDGIIIRRLAADL